MARIDYFLRLTRIYKDDIHTIGYLITVIIAVAGFIMLTHQIQLQTEAINLQTEAVKLQTEALKAQSEQVKFQRDALQTQINLNKPIITQNMYCPPLQPNTVNHAEYTIYNIGRSSGIYKMQFQSNNILLRAINFNCNTFVTLCTTEPDYAISSNDKEKYILDLKIEENAKDPEFKIKLQCISEDCSKEPAKSWTCRYSYNNETKIYEPIG